MKKKKRQHIARRFYRPKRPEIHKHNPPPSPTSWPIPPPRQVFLASLIEQIKVLIHAALSKYIASEFINILSREKGQHIWDNLIYQEASSCWNLHARVTQNNNFRGRFLLFKLLTRFTHLCKIPLADLFTVKTVGM